MNNICINSPLGGRPSTLERDIPIRTNQKVLIALTMGMIEEMDKIARVQHRNRSDFVREAIRLAIELHEDKQMRREAQLNEGAENDAKNPSRIPA